MFRVSRVYVAYREFRALKASKVSKGILVLRDPLAIRESKEFRVFAVS